MYKIIRFLSQYISSNVYLFKRKIRIGSIMQHEFKDCGAVCLQVILRYHHLYISLYELRRKAYYSINGINLYDLKKACEMFSLTALCYELSIGALIREFKEPCILHWRQNHFVVLYAIRKTLSGYSFYIMDPCVGRIRINYDTFKKAWLYKLKDAYNERNVGIALFLYPNTNFFSIELSKQEKGFRVKDFLMQFKFYKKHLTVILGCVVGANLIQFLFPFLTQNIIDLGIQYKQKDIIVFLLISQAVLIISSNIYELIRRRLILQVNSRVNIRLVSEFLYKLVKLPIRFFENRIIGDILLRITDHSKVEVFLTSTITDLVFCISTFILFSIVLLIYSVKIYSFFIIGTTLYIL